MTLIIWKFELRTAGLNRIKMPRSARILSCEYQGESLMLWAAVNEDNVQIERNIFVAVTGRSYEKDLRGVFVGTCGFKGYMTHVFDHGEG